jgi:hypothetical protein
MKAWGGGARTDVGIGLGDILQHQQPHGTETASLGGWGLEEEGFKYTIHRNREPQEAIKILTTHRGRCVDSRRYYSTAVEWKNSYMEAGKTEMVRVPKEQ